MTSNSIDVNKPELLANGAVTKTVDDGNFSRCFGKSKENRPIYAKYPSLSVGQYCFIRVYLKDW